jgi:hypothetical protein
MSSAKKEDPKKAPEKRKDELSEKDLGKVTGGARKRTGDPCAGGE